MDVNKLGATALALLLFFLFVGAGVLALDKFSTVSGVTTNAAETLNASRDSLATMATDWGPLIIVFIGIGAAIGILISSLAGRK